MSAYSGKFQYTGDGANSGQGPCEVSFDRTQCVITPASGVPIAFDLGDVDHTGPGEWDLGLTLYTGATVVLKQFGAAFSNMAGELLEAWRDRTVECLLLEDLEEVGRYAGVANGSPGEIRIYRSNLAFLPQAGMPMQWRLAEVESIVFDDAAYSIVLTRGGERLVLSKLAKKTDEVLERLQKVHRALREHAAAALRDVFPFLAPDRLMRLVSAMPEGRSVSIAGLNGIDARVGDALVARAVDESLKPYFDAMRARAAKESPMAGFKFIRADGEGAEAANAEEEQAPLFFWFFFPLPNGVSAWEATTGSGRATYFFRTPAPAAEAIGLLTRGLALVNFRREPVYLPDESLERQPRYHRYAIAARKLPELRAVRSAFLGRAIHSSVEEWQAQVDGVLGSR